MAFEGDDVEVMSYVPTQKGNCEDAYAYGETDTPAEWGCWRWFEPGEEYATEEPGEGQSSHSPGDPGIVEDSDVPFYMYNGPDDCRSVPAEFFETVDCYKGEGLSGEGVLFSGVEASLGTYREEPPGEAELLEPIAERILEESQADIVVLEARYTALPNSQHRVEVFASDEAQRIYEEYGIPEPRGFVDPVEF